MTAAHHSLKEMAMLLAYQDPREREESQVCQARDEKANRYEFFCKNACFLNKFVAFYMTIAQTKSLLQILNLGAHNLCYIYD